MFQVVWTLEEETDRQTERERQRERHGQTENWITAQEGHQTAGSRTHPLTHSFSHTRKNTQQRDKLTLCQIHRKILKQQGTARTHHKVMSYTQ